MNKSQAAPQLTIYLPNGRAVRYVLELVGWVAPGAIIGAFVTSQLGARFHVALVEWLWPGGIHNLWVGIASLTLTLGPVIALGTIGAGLGRSLRVPLGHPAWLVLGFSAGALFVTLSWIVPLIYLLARQ